MNKNMQSVLEGRKAYREYGINNGRMYGSDYGQSGIRSIAIKALSWVGVLLFVTLIVMVIIRDSHLFGG